MVRGASGIVVSRNYSYGLSSEAFGKWHCLRSGWRLYTSFKLIPFSHFYIMEWLIKMKNVLCCVQLVHFLADKSVLKPCEWNGPVDVSLAVMLGKA